jgi:hypothetical protein
MRHLILICALLALPACGGSPDDEAPPRAPGPTAADTVTNPVAQALSLAQRMDENLPFGAATTRTIEEPDLREPRVLRLWRQNGEPAKLMASEPDDAGRMRYNSTYYFWEGELYFARHPDVRMVLSTDMPIMLDDMLRQVDAPEDELEVWATRFREDAARYLEAFE